MSFGSVKLVHNNGTMHHLGIDETMVAKCVILMPDPLEVPKYAAMMENAEKVGEYREYVTYTGTMYGKPLSVMSCGFGCMPTAIAVEELKHLGVEAIVKIGLCPAIRAEYVPGELLAASGAVRGEGATREYVDVSYPAAPDMRLLSALLKCGVSDYGIFRSHDCLSMETPRFAEGRARLERWRELGVALLDGETSALYVVSSILGVRAVSVAMISENYATGERLENADVGRLFRAAEEGLLCC